MRYSIHLRPGAEVALEEAAKWYEKQREGLGRDFLNEVQHTWNAMAENPHLYPIVHRDTHRALIHRFPFAIFYRIERNALVIIAVMHGSRHPKRWQKRT
ncbi:MAG: type II toxin-antitoxin system RelE/ParE family toxin [Desulfobacterales bacterium]|nr:type II toxin-antitoxin system RelE/ParE family toxin [Desulfobacterales bacterium]